MRDNTPITEGGARGACALPSRKALDHRGPVSLNIKNAWYFVTLCAEGHHPWIGRAVAPRPPHSPLGRAVAHTLARPSGSPSANVPSELRSSVHPRPPTFDEIANRLLHEARESHVRGLWRLALFLVMPDHVHAIVHVPHCGGRGATALPTVVANFKHLVSSRHGLRFQRDFFDTRLRDDEQYGEKFRYICANPVRKGLCETPREWPYVVAFNRETGEEKQHK